MAIKIFIENFNEVMDRLQVEEIVVRHVHADAEVEASVAAVHNFEVSEFNKVCMFGISNSHN